MKKFSYFATTLLLILWIQILCNHFTGGHWTSVDGILIAVLYFGLARGPLVGQLMGFGWGLLSDASSLGLMGLHALIYAGAGYAAGMLRRQLDETKGGTQALFSLLATVISLALYLGIYRLFATTIPFPWHLSLQPVVNAIVAPLEFWLLQRWSELWAIFPVEN